MQTTLTHAVKGMLFPLTYASKMTQPKIGTWKCPRKQSRRDAIDYITYRILIGLTRWSQHHMFKRLTA